MTLILAMLVIIGIISMLVWMSITERTENHYFDIMQSTEESILRHLSNVEVASINSIPDLQAALHEPDRQDELLRSMLERNPAVQGYGLPFRAGYYPEKGPWHEPYATRDRHGRVVVRQIGAASHDYLHAEWFQEAVTSGKPFWSRPYYDDAGGHTVFITYLHPVVDDSGRMAAVLGADVSLHWLTEQLRRLDERNNRWAGGDKDWRSQAYSFIVDKQGKYITHPDTTRFMKSARFDNVTFIHPEDTSAIISNLRNYTRGLVEATAEGVDCYAFYKKIALTDWTLVMVVPKWMVRQPGLILLAVIAAIMLTALLVLWLSLRQSVRHITRPLLHFARSAQQVAKGEFDVPLPDIKTDDEIRTLHDSFQHMQQSLIRYTEELKMTTAQHAVTERDLSIAQAIQMAMLPQSFPGHDGCRVHGLLNPARQVGGDLYDYFVHGDNLYFCIGDVSGKGIPASLIMGMILAEFRTVTVYEERPHHIMTAINLSMSTRNESLMFVTLFVGVLHLPTGRLSYCNAGHEPPLLITPHDSDPRLLDIAHNIPIGLDSGWDFKEQETVLTPNTTLFLYTDGLTEAENMQHHQLGRDAISQAIGQVIGDSQLTPEKLTCHLADIVKTFVGDAEQSDDLTMLALLYMGNTMEPRQLTLASDVSEVSRLAAFVDDACEAAGFDMPTTMGMNLAMEEAVVNVINYAWPPDTKGMIDIQAMMDGQMLIFTITDDGKPFDPTKALPVDTTLPAEERDIGGLGIHLVRHYMDKMEYRRVNGRNILTLGKVKR